MLKINFDNRDGNNIYEILKDCVMSFVNFDSLAFKSGKSLIFKQSCLL